LRIRQILPADQAAQHDLAAAQESEEQKPLVRWAAKPGCWSTGVAFGIDYAPIILGKFIAQRGRRLGQQSPDSEPSAGNVNDLWYERYSDRNTHLFSASLYRAFCFVATTEAARLQYMFSLKADETQE
jgi:hypothetical protein